MRTYEFEDEFEDDFEYEFEDEGEAILRIEHLLGNGASAVFYLDPNDGKTVSSWIRDNIGEALNSRNGCPVFSEVAGWAEMNAGYDGLEYTFEDYPDINDEEWKITLWNLDDDAL